MNRESKHFLLSFFIISMGTPAQFIFAVKKADPLTGTLMVSFYFIFSAISSILFSKLSDRLMRRKIFAIIGFVLVASVFIAYFFASSPFELIVCSSMVGIGFSAYNPTSNALFSEMEPTIPSGKLMSYFFVVASAGWAVGSVIAGVVDQYFGDYVFIFGAFITLVGLSIYSLKVQDIPYDRNNVEDIINSKNSTPNPNLKIYSVLIIILSMAMLTRHLCVQGGFSLFPNYLEASISVGGLELESISISLLLAVNMTTQSIIMIPMGRLVDHKKFGRKLVLLFGLIGANITVFAWSLIYIPWIMIFPQMLIGFAWPALATAATALITDITTRRTRSQGLGWFNAGLAIGGSIGPIVSFFLMIQSAGNYRFVFQILSLVPVAGIILVLIAFSENKLTHEYYLFRRKK